MEQKIIFAEKVEQDLKDWTNLNEFYYVCRAVIQHENRVVLAYTKMRTFLNHDGFISLLNNWNYAASNMVDNKAGIIYHYYEIPKAKFDWEKSRI